MYHRGSLFVVNTIGEQCSKDDAAETVVALYNAMYIIGQNINPL